MSLLARRKKPALVDQDNRIIADVYCIRCGQNLRDLLLGERCPNCLHPASDSVFGDYLVHADRQLVQRLADAARAVRIAAAFLGGLIAIGLLVTLIAELQQRDLPRGIWNVFQLLFAGAMIAPLIAVVGMATLTNRHTVAYYQARYLKRRNLVLVVVLALLGLTGLVVIAQWFSRPIANLVLTAWAIGPVALFLHGLAQLMRRVPNKDLAGFAEFAFWGVLICGLALFCVLTLRHMAGDDKTWRDTQLGLTAIYAVGCIALGIGGYRLLLRAEETLRKAAR